VATVLASAASAAERLPLRTVADVPLSGGATRMDYQSIDPVRDLLFIAHMGDGAVVVIDTRRRSIVKTIENLNDVHGVLAVPSQHMVYASATGTNEIAAIDEGTLEVVARIPGGVYPDGMAFDPHTQRLFVSDERGRTETVIDTRSHKRVATIQLGGEAGNSQYDARSGRILVNVQTSGALLAIDPDSLKIVRRIDVSGNGCIGNHGLTIDDRYNRAFIACEDSATLLAVDLSTATLIGTWHVGDDPDVLALDPSRRLLYVASESGIVSIITSGATIKLLAQAFLASEAHTVAVDSKTHLVYFALQSLGGKPVLRVMEPASRPRRLLSLRCCVGG
jgi:DNA-binding beta-propeller fold protein YncE